MDSTNDHDYLTLNPDPAHVAALLEELKRVPKRLTPGDTRAALAESIRCGEVDGLYKPLGAGWWNVTLAALPPHVDPRIRLAEWVELWQAGKSAHTELLMRASRQNGGQG